MQSFPFMTRALALAEEAAVLGEVPVAAVITHRGEIIAEARNAMRSEGNATAHAEMKAIAIACMALGKERLEECDLWVTLEPCAMCAGAIAHARIARLYYAAPDPKGGAVDHGPRLFTQSTCHHRPEVYGGISEEAAAEMLRAFFREKRG
jgi:tRNA(adenine34) deaminase